MNKILVRRNWTLGITLTLRLESPDLNNMDKYILTHAVERPEKVRKSETSTGFSVEVIGERHQPQPVLRLLSLQDPALATCDRATLQPLVYSDSIGRLTETTNALFHAEVYDTAAYNWVRIYQSDRRYLHLVHLDIPTEIREKYEAFRAKMRLLGYVLPEEVA